MDIVDQITIRMRILLLVQAAGFFTWQAGEGLARSEQVASAVSQPAALAALVGGAVWAVGLIVYFAQAWRAKKGGLYDILHDEWAQHVRKRASETAFWVLMISVVVSMTLSNFGVDAMLLLKINVGVAVSSYFLANVWFDTRHESAS